MAFKFLLPLCAILAAASAGYVAPVTYSAAPVIRYANPAVDAVASTQHNVVRSFDGTVSSYSKSVNTPYSSVHKVDTRINNNVYTPTIAKTLTYAAPSVTYAAPAPVYTKTLVSSAPTVHTYAAPAPVVYSHAAPVVKQAIAYSPAASVAHVTFDGFGTHWGY